VRMLAGWSQRSALASATSRTDADNHGEKDKSRRLKRTLHSLWLQKGSSSLMMSVGTSSTPQKFLCPFPPSVACRPQSDQSARWRKHGRVCV
jgi:hypothetical protein